MHLELCKHQITSSFNHLNNFSNNSSNLNNNFSHNNLFSLKISKIKFHSKTFTIKDNFKSVRVYTYHHRIIIIKKNEIN